MALQCRLNITDALMYTKQFLKNVHAETQQIRTAYDHVYEIFHEVHDDVKMMQTEKLGLLFSVHAAGHHAKA